MLWLPETHEPLVIMGLEACLQLKAVRGEWQKRPRSWPGKMRAGFLKQRPAGRAVHKAQDGLEGYVGTVAMLQAHLGPECALGQAGRAGGNLDGRWRTLGRGEER